MSILNILRSKGNCDTLKFGQFSVSVCFLVKRFACVLCSDTSNLIVMKFKFAISLCWIPLMWVCRRDAATEIAICCDLWKVVSKIMMDFSQVTFAFLMLLVPFVFIVYCD